jgi:5-methyltetrahydropteroyltriglutamate--homocysteine methyltransferase
MHRSETHILTTHVGSLPRPPQLRDLLIRRERGEAVDEADFRRQVAAATQRVVEKQLEVGIDIGNNGEQPRVGFQTYVASRMQGFGGESARPPSQDVLTFPDYGELLQSRRRQTTKIENAPQAIADVVYSDLSEATEECDTFLQYCVAQPRQFTERFMTAASPGIIATTLLNAHYASYEDYVVALARQMQREYALICARGLTLQIDCPDLAMERTRYFRTESLERFQQIVEMHVAAINLAIADIPPERIRLHVCWGNYDGPHVFDVPLETILPIIYQARVGALSIELANPRHQHEYRVFKQYPLPDGMLFLPGVIDSTTNYVEHPEVVADRICQAVEAVGDRQRVIASTDCGFGTFAGSGLVAESVVWEKLRSLAQGAALATQRLWG